MDYIPLLRVCDFLPFVAFLNKIGAPTDKLLHAAKVPTRALDQAEALIPMYPVNAFLERAMRTEGLPHLGALVGGETSVDRFGAFGALVLQSLTLHDALATAERMMATFDSSIRVWRERQGDQVWVRFQNLTSGRSGREQGDLYTLMLLMNLVRRVAGPAWTPSEIHLQMRGNRELADMAALSATRLRFEQPAFTNRDARPI
jgi:hypothetical protein